jgi:hypothetical protein
MVVSILHERAELGGETSHSLWHQLFAGTDWTTIGNMDATK